MCEVLDYPFARADGQVKQEGTVRRLTLATITLGTLAALLPPTAEAGPITPGPLGRGCSYAAMSDPSPDADADAMTGQINAGPMIAQAGGTLHCIIRVNVNSHAGGGVAAHVECDADSTGVIVCVTTTSYASGDDDQDYFCMSYDRPHGAGTIYWHPADDKHTLDPADDEAGHWTTDATKPCAAATQISPRPPFDSTDYTLCDLLKARAGPGNGYFIDREGDVFVDTDADGDSAASYEADWYNELFWDCPLYTFDDGNPDLANGGVVDY